MVKFGWDKLKRFLAQANSWTGTQTFANLVITGSATIPTVLEGYTTTATAAGTTTLVVGSTYHQFFTGSTTQTVTMPVTSTLTLGHDFRIVNKSSGVVTVNSSGGNAIVAMVANSECVLTCILITGTTAASWDVEYSGISSVTGTGAMVLATSPTFVTPLLGTPTSGDMRNTSMAVAPAIGKTTPAELWGSPNVSKGPAIINSGFTGTISRSTTTLTFSAAADAILAGYSATNPILGTTVIHPTGPVTMYITAWLSSTTATVDSSGTLAAQTPTSFQLPIATFVNSAGVTQGWMNAAGNAYFIQNVGIGTTNPVNKLHVYASNNALFTVDSAGYAPVTFFTSDGDNPAAFWKTAFDLRFGVTTNGITTGGFSEKMRITSGGNILTGGLAAAGTSAAKVIAVGEGTAPTTAIANGVQKWSADYNGGAGDNRLHFMGEATATAATAIGSGKVSVKGAVASAGGFTRQLAEATSGALSGASGSIAVNVPTGARILGVQLRVDTLITAVTGVSWSADYVNTPTTAICAAQAFDKNTKFNAVHPAHEITTGTVTITITPNAGTFTAGVIRAIVYYEAIDAMSDAA